MKKIELPLDDREVDDLRVGDQVLMTGTLYTARDAAHKRGLPFDPKGQVIFYAGPTPGRPIGSIGPTTASRMDPFTLPLLEKGLKGMIGKGPRSAEVKEAIRKHRAVYFVATGGAAALLGKTVKAAETVAYPELGPEAVLKIEVVNFPAIVAYDVYGGDAFEEGIRKYKVGQ